MAHPSNPRARLALALALVLLARGHDHERETCDSGGTAMGMSSRLTCTPAVGPQEVRVRTTIDVGAPGQGDHKGDHEAALPPSTYMDSQLVAYPEGSGWAPKGSGRRATIAAVALGADGTSNFTLALRYLEAAGEQGVDLAILPEQFRGAPGMGKVGGTTWPAEPLDGPTITAVAAVAAKHGMYVVAPIRELWVGPPAANGTRTQRQYNSAVVIGRDGKVVGAYRKMFPVVGPPPPRPPLGPGAEAGVTPGTFGVPVFQLDFARVAVLTCFDINFAEVWASAAARQVDMVVWPSAMVVPDLVSRAYARLHQLVIVAVSGPFSSMQGSKSVAGEIVDSTGDPLGAGQTARLPGWPKMLLGEVDFGRVWVHADNNVEKISQLLGDSAGKLEAAAVPAWLKLPPFSTEARRDLPFYLLQQRSNASSGGLGRVDVNSLCEAHGIEALWKYVHRSRRTANILRQNLAAIPP